MNRFILVYFTLFVNCLSSQSIKPIDTMYVNYIGQEHGLLQLNVKDMALDELGYLWAGTEDGLLRFNGYEFKAYLHNPLDSTSIKDDHVRLSFSNMPKDSIEKGVILLSHVIRNQMQDVERLEFSRQN